MPFDPDASDLTVAVIGTGTMGRGIVQVSAQGGMRVIAYDEKPGAAQAAKDYIAKTLGGLVEKGRVPEADAKAAVDRIVVAKDMGDVGKANVVIEAIVEQLAAKQALFAKLEGVVGPEAILASNTSSIPITAIASQCKHPERVGGMHFFNPVPLMRLVEIIPGLQDGAVGDRRHDGAGPAHDARAGAVHRQPRVPGQSRGPRLRAGVAAHPDREHCRRSRHRPHPHRRARASGWGRSRWPTWSASTSSTA